MKMNLPGLCAKDSFTDTSSATTPPIKPHVFAVKSVIPPSYAISFPPVETLIPITLPPLMTTLNLMLVNLISSLVRQLPTLHPPNLDQNGKPLTYKIAFQGPDCSQLR